MATTPNYGWVTPAPTDFVTDLPADFETFADAADASVKALNPGTTAGDLDYYTSGTAKSRLAIGTAGQVLTVNSGATAPEWAAPATGGGMTELATGTITGTLNLTSIDQNYFALVLYVIDFTNTSVGSMNLRFNNDSGNNYYAAGLRQLGATTDLRNTNGGTSVEIAGTDYAANTGDNSCFIYVPNYTAAAHKLAQNYLFQNQGNTSNFCSYFQTIGYKSTTAISEINILNVTAGSYKLYGVK